MKHSRMKIAWILCSRVFIFSQRLLRFLCFPGELADVVWFVFDQLFGLLVVSGFANMLMLALP